MILAEKISKNIESLIDSFLSDLNYKKIEALDDFLLMLLLHKESLFLRGKRKEARDLEKIIREYADYRVPILNRGLEAGVRMDVLRNKIYRPLSRLVFLVTNNCQLRCRYCKFRKNTVSMDEATFKKGIRLFVRSGSDDMEVHFFGGEPLLNFDLIKKGTMYAEKLAKKHKKKITFIIPTNGIALDREKIDFFKKHRFAIKCSIDGNIKDQLKNRPILGGINYMPMVLENFRNLIRSGVNCGAVSVVVPDQTPDMFKNFVFLAEVGFKKIQINYGLGVVWSDKKRMEFFSQSKKIAVFAKRRGIQFTNSMVFEKEPISLNAGYTIDSEGDIYLGSGICQEEDLLQTKKRFPLGSLRGVKLPTLWQRTKFQNLYLLTEGYSRSSPRRRRIIVNNVLFGLAYREFLKKIK
jgi:sulfatase maturation enzyme AslB (radical SAM superfamily)